MGICIVNQMSMYKMVMLSLMPLQEDVPHTFGRIVYLSF